VVNLAETHLKWKKGRARTMRDKNITKGPSDPEPTNPRIREALRRRARQRVKSARWNGYVLTLAFVIFAVTAVLAIKAQSTTLVAGFAVAGLAALWLFSAMQARTLERESMENEVAFYNSLLAAGPELQHEVPEAAEKIAPTDLPLSDREIEVLRQVAMGRTNKEVALALSISEQTVKNHLMHIYSKLDVNDRTSAILVANRSGLIDR
jgi:DNA-binding CsgD family transcriptional regulator